MQSIEKRLLALEKSSPTAIGPIFIHFVALGGTDAEIERIEKGNQEWQRQPDESEQELKDRAISEVPPPKPGCSLVFLCH